MTNIIINHGGTIDKYMGDAIMAEFGAPLPQPDHPMRACRAALDMVATLADLNSKWAEEGRPLLSVGIGINTGHVAIGNMGSERLFDYTAIGDNVNLGSRLEGLNKYYGTNILISETTAAFLGDDFILRDVDRVKVKGKAQSVGIFEVLGEGPPETELDRFLEAYHQALRHYRAKCWDECVAEFQSALKLRPRDVATHRYLGLARKLAAEPPPPEWEPVTIMDGK
jgi:adenylate cyclase